LSAIKTLEGKLTTLQDGRHYKIDISPYLSAISSDFDEILYTAADFELDEHHVIKNEKFALDRLRVQQNVFLVNLISCHITYTCDMCVAFMVHTAVVCVLVVHYVH